MPLRCQRPDRDCPKLKCGHPLPCQYHTAILDLAADPPSVAIMGKLPSPSQLAKLHEIARILKGATALKSSAMLLRDLSDELQKRAKEAHPRK